MDEWMDGQTERGGRGWWQQPADSSVLPEVSLVDGQCPLEAGGAAEAGDTEAALELVSSPSPGRINVKNEELEAMVKEAPGPINFTVFLTMFGEKLKGE